MNSTVIITSSVVCLIAGFFAGRLPSPADKKTESLVKALSSSVVLVEPEGLHLGKGNGIRTKVYEVEIPSTASAPAFLKVGAVNGGDDSGDRAITYRIESETIGLLKKGSMSSSNINWASTEVQPGDQIKIYIEDLDTKSTGKRAGNWVHVTAHLSKTDSVY